MKLFLDTNLMVAAVIKQHAFHARSFSVFHTVLIKQHEGCVAAHSLAEMYGVLTKFPPPYRHSPEQALFSIEENILKHFSIISLKRSDYAAVLRDAAGAGIQGGTIYDALLLRCAEVSGADRIYTLNLKDFSRLANPQTAKRLYEP